MRPCDASHVILPVNISIHAAELLIAFGRSCYHDQHLPQICPAPQIPLIFQLCNTPLWDEKYNKWVPTIGSLVMIFHYVAHWRIDEITSFRFFETNALAWIFPPERRIQPLTILVEFEVWNVCGRRSSLLPTTFELDWCLWDATEVRHQRAISHEYHPMKIAKSAVSSLATRKSALRFLGAS